MARPKITLKIASSLDGKIALANGQSEWVTGDAAREHGRRLRGSHDAIAIGANTARLDNPQLTTRIAGLSNPARVVFDTRAKLSPHSNLAQTTGDSPVYLIVGQINKQAKALAGLGVNIIETGVGAEGRIDVPRALELLHRQGLKSLLLEGGGTLAASFIKADVIDVIEWYRASIIVGGDGRSSVGGLGLEVMEDSYRFERVSIRDLGIDVHERYERVRG
ncbi:MAG: RibD family protein [Maricaulaceae bacterium]